MEKDLGETSIKVITHTWEIVDSEKKNQAREELGGIPSLRGQKEKEK